MTLVITHSKVSTKPVGSDSSRIYSDSWNANHTLTGVSDASQLNANVVQAVTNDTNIQGSISAQNLTFLWAGTLAASRLNGNVVQAVTNDTNITGTISAQNITLGWTGTLAATRLNSNVVQGVTNDTNITGTVSAQNLAFGWTGTLGVARGGLGGSLAATGGTSQVLKQTTLGGAVTVGQLAFTDIPGSVAATQMPALTGNVTTSAGSTVTTIAANAVTNAMHATMPAFTFKANNTSGAATPTDITIDGLTLKASPAAGDEVIIWDVAGAALKKATVSGVGASAGVSSIAGNTGAFTLGTGLTNSVNVLQLSTPVAVANGGTGYTGGAWTAYAPTITASSGIFTTVSAAGAYLAIGKLVHFNITVTITTAGTAATWVNVPLPTGTCVRAFSAVGSETAVNGKALSCFASAGASALIVRYYDATAPIANGLVLTISGCYEMT